jgi:hypothetical protein
MLFTFGGRQSDSPFVEMIWRTQSERAGSFISLAESRWEMVVTKYQGRTTFTVRGPETKATPADSQWIGAEFFGIVFKLGTFMPHLPIGKLRDRNDLTLPEATNQSFWLLGMAWEIPSYDNADTFVNRMVRDGVLVRDGVIDAVLQSQPHQLSPRSMQYRFLRATGLTYTTIQQIERAKRAMNLLQQGTTVLDTVHELGYFDQPHLTRSLKRFMGQTPAQIAVISQPA